MGDRRTGEPKDEGTEGRLPHTPVVQPRDEAERCGVGDAGLGPDCPIEPPRGASARRHPPAAAHRIRR